jgi:AAA15 family ATPase/GTPase
MHLTSIDIENFRGFDALKVEDFGQVNVIVGRNNSGKTSLLEAILLSVSSTKLALSFRLQDVRQWGYRSMDVWQGLFYNLSFENSPVLKTSWNTSVGEQEREIRVEAKERRSYTPVNEPVSDFTKALLSLDQLRIGQIDISTKLSSEQGPLTLTVGFAINGDLTGINANLARPDKAFDPGPATTFIAATYSQEETMSRVNALTENKRKSLLVDELKKVDSRIRDIETIRNSLFVDMEGVDKLLPLKLMGDGIQKVLSILSALLESDDSTIVLADEIENGLHYSAHITLWKAIFRVLPQTKAQLFVTTHSLETLRYLNEALKTNESMQPQVRVYDLVKTKKAGYQAYKYTYAGLSDAIENETEIRR